jgi:tetratricopeptide (TPR) repeat protein
MKIGPYEVAGVIGEGGSGRVYHGRAPDGREVAVKVLLERRGDAVARFERESRLLARLGQAEGFIPVVDLGESLEVGPYFVMPFLEGGDLRARLRKGPLPVGEAVELGIRLARALGRAHELGVIHRDVKPGNVLFARSGERPSECQPLLGDLGLAKHFDREAPGGSASASLSKTGSFRGTLAYTPPEQLTDAKSVGPAADVYALGVVLYECLAGHLPHDAGTVVELLVKVTDGKRVPLRTARRDVPNAVAAVVERALAHDPRKRFANGAELAAALEAARSAPETWGRRVPVLVALLLAAGGLVTARALLPRDPVAVAPVPGSTAAPAPSPTPRAATPRDLAREAEQALRRRELARADELLGRAAASAADDALVLAVRAHLECLRDNDDQALALAGRALDRDPRSVVALLTRSSIRTVRGDLRRALEDARLASEIDSGDGHALLSCAQACRNMGDFREALRDLAKAITVEPELENDFRFHLVRAIARMDAGNDLAGARADLDRALELDPKDVMALTSRAQLRLGASDWKGALDDANRAIELGDDTSATWSKRSIANTQLGHAQLALSDAEHAIARNPQDAAAYAARAQAKLALDADGATDDLERALTLGLDPERAAAARRAFDEARGKRR